MQRVTGIGGIFLRARDPLMLREWYQRHLGIDIQPWGGTAFRWEGPGTTVWSMYGEDSPPFAGRDDAFVVNYRVADLHALIAALRAEGCEVDPEIQESEYGRFGWVTDPEGHRVELWEPPAGS